MEISKKVKMLQTFYAGVMADCVLRLGKEGILEKVAAEKRAEQLHSGKTRAQQLGIQTKEQVFEVLPDIFECANWKVEKNESGFTAEATGCMLCAMAKRIGAKSPCGIYCLDPMEGLVKGIDETAEFNVVSTLYDGGVCKVNVG